MEHGQRRTVSNRAQQVPVGQGAASSPRASQTRNSHGCLVAPLATSTGPAQLASRAEPVIENQPPSFLLLTVNFSSSDTLLLSVKNLPLARQEKLISDSLKIQEEFIRNDLNYFLGSKSLLLFCLCLSPYLFLCACVCVCVCTYANSAPTGIYLWVCG